MRWQTIRTLLYVLPFLSIVGFFWRDLGQAPAVVSIISFILFVGVVGRQWEHIFERVYGLRERDMFRSILAWGFVVLMLGFGVGAAVIFGSLKPGIMPSIALSIAVLSTVVYTLTTRTLSSVSPPVSIRPGSELSVYRVPKIWLLVSIVLGLAIVWFMVDGRSEASFSTPWQILHSYIPILGFLLFVVLGALVTSKTKISRVLFGIVFASFVLHAYVPLSHVLPWGGDIWRHMATESILIEENSYGPVLFGAEVTFKEVRGILVPEVFFATHKFTYGQFWGLSVFLHRFLGLDLISLGIWLGPLLWSLLVPLLLFRIGAVLFGSWRHALLLAALSLLPFSLQAVGGFTLPITLGYISFLYGLLFWVTRQRDKYTPQTVLAICWGVLMTCGYVVPVILWWTMVFGTLLVSFLFAPTKYILSKIGKGFLLGLGVAFSLCLFPLLEIVLGLSAFPTQVAWRDLIFRIVGEWSGFYYADLIRPHDILSGNVLFNHTPLEAFVDSPFTRVRWHVVFLSLGFLLLSLIGFWRATALRVKQWIPLLVLGLTMVGGYTISWYGLLGEHSFVRRFDPMLAILLLCFAIAGGIVVFRNMNPSLKTLLIPMSILFLAFSTVTIWMSGPDTRVLSVSAVEAAFEVAETNPSCVLSDTWELLPLEYALQGSLIGGGFPITHLFGQSERTELYAEFVSTSTPSMVYEKVRQVLQQEHCAIFVPKEKMRPEAIADVARNLGQPQEVGSYLLWLAPPRQL